MLCPTNSRELKEKKQWRKHQSWYANQELHQVSKAAKGGRGTHGPTNKAATLANNEFSIRLGCPDTTLWVFLWIFLNGIELRLGAHAPLHPAPVIETQLVPP